MTANATHPDPDSGASGPDHIRLLTAELAQLVALSNVTPGVALSALLSLYRHYALQYPCCRRPAVENLHFVADELLGYRNSGGQLVPTPPPATGRH